MLEKITIKEYAKLTKQAANFDYDTVIEKMIAEVVNGLSMVNTKTSVKELMEKKLAPRLKILADSNKALKNLLALDREKEYELLRKLKEKSEKQLQEALDAKNYHGNKLKAIQELEAKNKAQAKIIEALQFENSLLKPKSPSPSNDSNFNLKQGGSHAR